MVKTIIGIVGLMGVGLGIVMATTNPQQDAFEDFALQRLREEGCTQVPLGLASQCPRFVDDNKAQIKQIMSRNTERRDFVLFSYYQTDLSMRSLVPNLPFMPMLPTFHFQTVGVLGKFYLFEAKKEHGSQNPGQ